jgi:hypothetical protein
MDEFLRDGTRGGRRARAIATTRTIRFWLLLVAIIAATVLVGAYGLSAAREPEDAATNLTPIAPNVPEQDLADVPQGLEEASLTIDGGKFVDRGLSLQQNQPTVLRIINRDDQSYQLQIVPAFVDPTPIAASTTTQIEITDPDGATYCAIARARRRQCPGHAIGRHRGAGGESLASPPLTDGALWHDERGTPTR